MKLLAEAFPEEPIAKQSVSQLPWGHVIRLLQMVKDPDAREFYIHEALAHGWSRSMLETQIKSRLHLRSGRAQNNFSHTMPPQTQLTESLPEDLRGSLPSIAEIEAELSRDLEPEAEH